MKVEVIPSFNQEQFTDIIVVDGVNTTLSSAFQTVNAATIGHYKISITADIYEEDLILSSVVPLTIEGNGHLISNCIKVDSSMVCEVRPDYLLVDGKPRMVSSSVSNHFDISQYELLSKDEGTRSSDSWPYTVSIPNAPEKITSNVNIGDSYIMWHSRWHSNIEYITGIDGNNIVVTPIAARAYNGSDQVYNAYKAMNIVSESEYYYTSTNGGYLLHVPFQYTELRYARKPRVLSLESACNVTLQNATIIGSNFIHRGASQSDKAMYYNSAIYIRHGANIKILGCTFKGCPNGCITSRGKVDGLWVEKCDFIDIYGKGIQLGASSGNPTGDLIDELEVHSSPSDNTTRNVNIYDCSFIRCGSLMACASPIFLQNIANANCCRNTILVCSYSAIAVGWSFNKERTVETLSNIYIAYNHIGYVGMHLLSDLGGIYTIGECPNGYIIGNLIHDVYSLTGLLGMGCYNDEASKYWYWYKNLIVGCDRFYQNNFNIANLFDSCIFAYSNETAIALNNPAGTFFEKCIFKTNKDISNRANIQADMCVFNSYPSINGIPINGRHMIGDAVGVLFPHILEHDFSVSTSATFTFVYAGNNYVITANGSESPYIELKAFALQKGVVTNRGTRDDVSDAFSYNGETYDISEYPRLMCKELYEYSNEYINAVVSS